MKAAKYRRMFTDCSATHPLRELQQLILVTFISINGCRWPKLTFTQGEKQEVEKCYFLTKQITNKREETEVKEVGKLIQMFLLLCKGLESTHSNTHKLVLNMLRWSIYI